MSALPGPNIGGFSRYFAIIWSVLLLTSNFCPPKPVTHAKKKNTARSLNAQSDDDATTAHGTKNDDQPNDRPRKTPTAKTATQPRNEAQPATASNQPAPQTTEPPTTTDEPTTTTSDEQREPATRTEQQRTATQTRTTDDRTTTATQQQPTQQNTQQTPPRKTQKRTRQQPQQRHGALTATARATAGAQGLELASLARTTANAR